jgi:hypothetical protein
MRYDLYGSSSRIQLDVPVDLAAFFASTLRFGGRN